MHDDHDLNDWTDPFNPMCWQKFVRLSLVVVLAVVAGIAAASS